ncbi:MAG: FaeA/PapI family transcriptional regulator [Eubacteriales bacterium]|nr:FaeA/PapI family transcriptional regulator [Eubacteriales bacterium]
MRENSSKRDQVLEVIIGYIMERGYPPTTREIGKLTGLKSTSSVNSYLDQLKELGKIETDEDTEGYPRALRVKGFRFVKVEEEEV